MGELPNNPGWMLWSAFAVIAVGAALMMMVLYWISDGHPILRALFSAGLCLAIPWVIERSRRVLKGTEPAGRHAADTEAPRGPWVTRHDVWTLLEQLDMEGTYEHNLRLA